MYTSSARAPSTRESTVDEPPSRSTAMISDVCTTTRSDVCQPRKDPLAPVTAGPGRQAPDGPISTVRSQAPVVSRLGNCVSGVNASRRASGDQAAWFPRR